MNGKKKWERHGEGRLSMEERENREKGPQNEWWCPFIDQVKEGQKCNFKSF